MNENKNKIIFKIAEEESEFEQIYRLNYETFVEEIPQHQKNEERKLIDKYDKYNTYIIAKKGDEVIGMLSISGKRPFSVEQKLKGDFEKLLPVKGKFCETRLLSVKKPYRGLFVFAGLFSLAVKIAIQRGYEYTLISGTLRQMKLYKHIGFKPFAYVVGTKEAPYQPMYAKLEDFDKYIKKYLKKKLNL